MPKKLIRDLAEQVASKVCPNPVHVIGRWCCDGLRLYHDASSLLPEAAGELIANDVIASFPTYVTPAVQMSYDWVKNTFAVERLTGPSHGPSQWISFFPFWPYFRGGRRHDYVIAFSAELTSRLIYAVEVQRRGVVVGGVTASSAADHLVVRSPISLRSGRRNKSRAMKFLFIATGDELECFHRLADHLGEAIDPRSLRALESGAISVNGQEFCVLTSSYDEDDLITHQLPVPRNMLEEGLILRWRRLLTNETLLDCVDERGVGIVPKKKFKHLKLSDGAGKVIELPVQRPCMALLLPWEKLTK